MNWYTLLKLSMPMLTQIPLGYKIFYWKGQKDVVSIWIGPLSSKSSDFITSRNTHELGHITIINQGYRLSPAPRNNSYWEVGAVEATHGYGPLLYQLAMQYAKNQGGILVSRDSDHRSPEAQNVWNKFKEREDIGKHPLPHNYIGYTLT